MSKGKTKGKTSSKGKISSQPIKESELILGYREVKIQSKGTIRIYRPTTLISEKADLAYSAKRRALLLEPDPAKKVMTHKQLATILEKSGDWTAEDDILIEKIRKEILATELDRTQFLNDLEAADESEKPRLQTKLDETQLKLMELWAEFGEKIREREIMFGDTVESYASLERRLMLVVLCCKNVDDKPIWASLDEIKREDLTLLTNLLAMANKYWEESNSEESVSFFDPSPDEQTLNSNGD